MCNPDYIFRTAPEVLAGGLHHKENVLQTFWALVIFIKRVLTHFLTTINGFSTLPSYKYHPSLPPFLTQTYPTLSSSSPLLQRCVSIVGFS